MPLHRRFFLKALGTLGLGSTLSLKQNIAKVSQEESFQFTSTPYLQYINQDTVCIVATFNKAAFAWVEIIDDNGKLRQTIYQSEDGMRNANSDLFKFHVIHFKQNFTYRVVAKEVLRFEAYKIEYGKIIYSAYITTQLYTGDNSVNLLIVNDIHENIDIYSDSYEKSSLIKKRLSYY